MDIDITQTIVAFDKVSDDMEYLTRQVHDYVLLSGFLDTHRKAVGKAVDSIAQCNEELTIQTFIGKLKFKLPQLRMGIPLHEFDKARAQVIAATLIAQMVMEGGEYVVDRRVKPFTLNGDKKFRTEVYIQFGGSYEKDLLKGIEDTPGVVNQKEVNGWKLSSNEKAFLRKVASIPLCLSEVCTEDLLLKGYSLKVDWDKSVDKNGKSLPEDPIIRKKRFRKYAEVIMSEVATKPVFYLPMKYCGRDRMYYEAARLDGIRPHGKLWETLMIDAAVPFDLTEEDERVLRHIIYVTLHGRVSVDEANDKFSFEDVLEAQLIDPFEQEDEATFGEAILLNKAYQALTDYQNGNTSRFMFGYDFTNSGLLMSGVSFRSEKMMDAANIGGSDQVVDSHTAFGDAYDIDLDRKDIKSIHMGLMHGSALGTIAKTITETVGSLVTVDDVKVFNEKAYGECVSNITRIAEWGSKIVGNKQSVLRWTMPDGFSACSRAYLKSVPLLVYCASKSAKEGYVSYLVNSDMPWVEDKNGYPMYDKDVEQKRRGLFADITHSIDAYMLRCITDAVLASGRPILLKHDDYIVPASAQSLVLEVAQEIFSDMFSNNLYQEAVDEIIENSPYNLGPMELVVGDAEDTCKDSECFLMP